MKHKIAVGLIVFAMLPFIAKAVPDIAFYLFIAVFAVIIVLIFNRKKNRPDSRMAKYVPGVENNDSKRRRIINAVRAVRKNRMTLTQASAHFGVTEREIKTFHYLDYVLTYT
jgi:hypothetical protein